MHFLRHKQIIDVTITFFNYDDDIKNLIMMEKVRGLLAHFI